MLVYGDDVDLVFAFISAKKAKIGLSLLSVGLLLFVAARMTELFRLMHQEG